MNWIGRRGRTTYAKDWPSASAFLKPDGVLIFKWNETDILLREVLALTPYRPLFGHPSGKASKTHWVAFTKSASTINPKDAAKPREVV